jgi:hypothetical protein
VVNVLLILAVHRFELIGSALADLGLSNRFAVGDGEHLARAVGIGGVGFFRHADRQPAKRER